MLDSAMFRVTSSPHIRSGETTQRIMLDVIIALMPALFAGVFYFGIRALIVALIAVVFAVGTEVVMQKVLKRPVTVNDLSAVVTGLLLAFNVPSTAPWWLVAIGSIFAIAVVKHCFGGLGHNFMNPALAARALLLASWPVRMTSSAFLAPGADAVSTATPLALIKGGMSFVNGAPVAAAGEVAGQALPSIWNLFIGNVGGCIGETSALALLIGGLYLVYRGVISIRIPGVYIGTVAVLSFILGGFNPYYPIYHVFAGGLFLGAFFMATDYASSPMTAKGQIAMGIGAGVLTVLIRFFGAYPEGVSYSILLMNVATPLIDRFTMPKKFGEVKKSA
ncbi:RnfABCDGE type electron transport complex subunit D [Lutispora thermophila]|uniref:Ion-translocating oxidoreductase complex subunit D n=1 Tax=Lutispora saccharofermentans TaxID=3024236 RepID=A0ABT1NB54_9FIRM|nr:RnfABCDGE type electron transport complex subunit D [Lutispora saccharofermentans]